MSVTNVSSLQFVFAGLDFPARRWQLVAQALDYGVDAGTCDSLGRIPPARYASLAQVAQALHAHEAPYPRPPVDIPSQRTSSAPVLPGTGAGRCNR